MASGIHSDFIQTGSTVGIRRVRVLVSTRRNTIQLSLILRGHQTICGCRCITVSGIRRSLPSTIATKITSLLSSSRSRNQTGSTSGRRSGTLKSRIGCIRILRLNGTRSTVSSCKGDSSSIHTQTSDIGCQIFAILISERLFHYTFVGDIILKD